MTNHDDEARARTQKSEDLPPGPARARTVSETAETGALLAGRYRVLRTLAAGGMGTVYEGEHVLLGHRVAIKMLHPQYAHSEASTKRFMNEARAAAQLRHPNIARCDDIGVTPDGHPFLVLELLSGRDLCDELGATGPFSLARTLEVGRQVAQALGYAHAQGVVHRDMKPENVFLARSNSGSEVVKVLDFGVARFIGLEHTSGTRTGAAIGTPLYMAPEQFTDASRVEARADVYGLGVVMYEMLTGQRPFDAPTLPELLSRMSSGKFTPLEQLRGDVPAHVARAIHACLHADPARRPASMDALLGMLEGTVEPPLAVAPVSATPPAPSGRMGRWAALALAIVAAVGAYAWWARPTPPADLSPPPARGSIAQPRAPALEPAAAEAAPAPVLTPSAPPTEPGPAAPVRDPGAAESGERKPSRAEERAARQGKKAAPARSHPIADEPDF